MPTQPSGPPAPPPAPHKAAPTTLLWGASPADVQALQQALAAAGLAPGAALEGAALVQQMAALAPQRLLLHAAQAGAAVPAWCAALKPWGGAPPCAVCAFAPGLTPEQATALAAAGVTAWWPALAPDSLAAQLAFAQALHQRQQALAAQLDERKWVDRAKGLLMAACALPEDQAYKLLRGAAMQAHLKLAEVSRAVVDAARRAEAINRAGQLRMLSQRLVALGAQRLARLDAAHARTQAKAALERMRDNIAHLAALTAEGPVQDAAADALAAVQRHGQALAHTLVAARLDATGLALADAEATALLQAADALAAQLQAQSGRRTLAIVNLCGSQRMRVQSLVKDALLARLLPASGPQRSAQAEATMGAYEAVQAQLGETPLSSAPIRSLLAGAQEGWLALLRAWRAADLAAVVHGGEHLLGTLEQLTEQFEHSLQVLMA